MEKNRDSIQKTMVPTNAYILIFPIYTEKMCGKEIVFQNLGPEFSFNYT